MSNFCEQYDLPLIALSRKKRNKKHDKAYKDYKYKRYIYIYIFFFFKNVLLNPMIFMIRNKQMFIRNMISKNLVN